MSRREAVGVHGGSVVAVPVDVSRRLLAHGEHALAGIKGFGEASSVISVDAIEIKRSAWLGSEVSPSRGDNSLLRKPPRGICFVAKGAKRRRPHRSWCVPQGIVRSS